MAACGSKVAGGGNRKEQGGAFWADGADDVRYFAPPASI
jgi:hypothetical protein